MTATFSENLPFAPPTTAEAAATFQNPIGAGADPWVVWHEGWYYWCLSENRLGIAIYRSSSLTSLGEKISGWFPEPAGPHGVEVRAPELHRIDGQWYVYVAASKGDHATHRMIVLSVAGDHPTGDLSYKAELYTGDDIARRTNNRWAIHGTLLEHGSGRYFLWSGWERERDEQWLYIARMENPWTISSNRVRLCANNDFMWERVGENLSGRGLNEAPQVLQRDGRVFVIYSASGSWEPSYKLGLLELRPGGNPMQPRDWSKHAKPVFESTLRTWGVGHCSFTRSPDGSEDWIAFHAKRNTAPNWDRVIHVQPFTWDATGVPVLGKPHAPGATLAVPAGDVASATGADAVPGRGVLLAAV